MTLIGEKAQVYGNKQRTHAIIADICSLYYSIIY